MGLAGNFQPGHLGGPDLSQYPTGPRMFRKPFTALYREYRLTYNLRRYGTSGFGHGPGPKAG